MLVTPSPANKYLPPYLSLICRSANTCIQDSLFFKKRPTIAKYDLKGSSVLVIDDNLVNHIVMKMITKKWKNTTVDFAKNGKEGLKKLSRKRYDVVVMELHMPVMDGYETTLKIRRGKEYEMYRDVPIIALTSDRQENAKTRALEIGINKYLGRPINEDILFECISSLVKV